MSDETSRFREGFERLLADMPEPPTLHALSIQPVEPRRSSRLNTGWVAFAMGAAVVLVAGAVLFAIRGGQPPVQARTVQYVKLEWSQHFELRCLGMDIVDNGGFDEAVVEIWGPSSDNLIRIDTTAPDGTVTRVVVEPGISGAEKIWTNGSKRFNTAGYRVSDCDSGETSFSMAQPPEFVGGSGYELWLSIVRRQPDGSVIDLEDIFGRDAAITSDTWLGEPVAIYRTDRSGTNELGDYESASERWWDPARKRLERWIIESDDEVLGSGTTTYSVVDRAVMAESDVSFAVEDLTLVFDQSQYEPADTQAAATTSIPPLGLPLMNDAVEIAASEIPKPLTETISPKPGDQLFLVPGGTDRSIIVRLRAGDQPSMYATSCDVLTSVELPEGWSGTCLERTVDGQRITGEFSYKPAASP